MGREDLSALRAELRARGYYRRRPGRTLGELGALLAVFTVGLGAFVTSDGVLARGLALLLMTVISLGVGANTHTASHYAATGSRRLDELLTYFGYPFFLQFSATYWWHKHVRVHHRSPNVIGLDADADFLPFFALNEQELARCSPLRRAYYRAQGVILPFAIVGNAFSMQLWGWRHLIGTLRDPANRRRAHWIDLGALVLHWAVWIIGPMWFFRPIDVVTFHLVRFGLLSYALFAALAPAHLPAEAAFLEPEDEDTDADFVLLQTATTLNFRTGAIGRLLCAGLQYQIEHHLFPGISYVYYPEVSRIVRAYCREHGYPYRTLGWGEAVWKALMAFYRPKPVDLLSKVADAGVRAA